MDLLGWSLRRSVPCKAAVLVCLLVTWPAVRSAAGIAVHLNGPSDNRVCLGCHRDKNLKKKLADGRVIDLHVDESTFEQTVHAGRTCTECHTQITQIPHKLTSIERVDCGRCHYVDEIEGTVMPSQPKAYRESVHKQALEQGNQKAPTCQDCHGSHNIFAPTDRRSSVYKLSIPKTCGRCHIDIYSDYRGSIHGRALARGNMDVPVCTNCHGEHSIRSPKDPKSKVYPTNIPETCSKCHASARIEKKYRLPTKRYETYRESYHGIANKFGSLTVANCASCHGAHDIRPSIDPTSSINRANLPKTCGKCHKGANANFARGQIHVVVEKKGQMLLYYVSNGFKWLTILTMTMLLGHIGLDLLAKYRRRNSQDHLQ